MKKKYLLVYLCFLSFLGYSQTVTYNYTGGVQTYTVPVGVTAIDIDIRGANGGGVNCAYGGGTYQSIGGCGGRVQATLAVTPGHVLNVIVGGSGNGTGGGGGGYGGGGSDLGWSNVWPGAGGGGGTTIIDNTTGTTLAVAGGGGGGGGDFCVASGTGSGIGDVGGAGGALVGANGNSNACGPPAGLGGAGGTQIAGGAGSACGGAPGGNPGTLGVGGNSPAANLGSGGGGGGYYGGGAGDQGGGGGGGSNYTIAAATTVTNTQGFNCGAGIAIIAVACTGPALITGSATSICIGTTIPLSDATAGGVWSTATSAVATISATGVITGVTQGISVVTYTIPATGCYQLYTDTVVLTPGAISGGTSICSGSSITLSTASIYGTWSSSNTAIETIGLTTGVLTGVAAGTASITYSNVCGTTIIAITDYATPGAIAGAITVCPGSTIILSDALTGGVWSSVTTTVATVTPGTGIVSGVSSGTSAITYTTAGGCTAATTITVNPGPPTFTITPPSATFCTGSQMLTVPVYTTTLTTTFLQTTAPFNIPNNTPAGVINNIAVAIPTTATIITAAVKLNNVAMNDDGQLTFNIQAPSGSNLNLVDRRGAGTNRNFTNTIISSAGATSLATGTAPYTGTFVADAAVGIGPTAYLSNVTTWPPLYIAPNGNWALCARDWVNPTTGTVNQWSLILTYTVPATYTWAPATGLYTNSGLTVPYVAGTTAYTVYASPGSTTTYTATATLFGYTCTSSSTATITIGGSGGGITGVTTVCSGLTTALTTGVGGGTWSSSNSSVATVTPGPGAGGGIVSGVSPGTAVISYSNGCVTTTTVTVDGPPGTISGNTSICLGGTTTTLIDGVGGTWSSSNTAVASIGTGTGLVTTGIAGTTTITYSNGCGTATAIFTAVPGPTAIIGGPLTLCSGGASTALSDATVGGTWSSGTVAVASVGSLTGLVTSGGLASGTTGTAVISYSNGCGIAPTTTVTINAPPGAIIGNLSICAGVNTTLSDAVGGTWSSGAGSVATVTPGPGAGVVSGVSGGSSFSTSVITYSNGCIPAAIATVTVTAIPTAITGIMSVCTGSSMTLSDAITGGTWISGSAANATVTLGPGITGGVVSGVHSGTTTITYSNGCGSPVTTVTVNTAPTAISGALIICTGGTTTLSNNGSPTGTWTSSNVSVATIDPITGIVGTVGTVGGTTTITAANVCGSTSILFTVSNPTPISGVLTFCQDITTTLSDGVPGGTWSSGNVSVATTTGTVNDGIIYGAGSGTSSGCAPITYTLSTGCFVTTTVCTTPAPTGITGLYSICVGFVTDLTDATAGGVWSSSNPGVATVGSGGDVHGISGGTTVIDYTIGACYATATITVNPLPAAITGPSAVCVSSTITLSDTSPFGNWSSSNSSAATIGGGTGIVTGVSAGTTTITYTLVTGCIITTSITVNPLPLAITGNTTICYGQSSQLSDGTASGTWSSSNLSVAGVSVGGGLVSTGPPASAVGGTTTITYTLPTGCAVVTTFTVNPLPGVIIGPTSLCAGATATLIDGPSGGTWSSSNVTAASVVSTSGGLTGGNVIGSSQSTVITYSLSTGCTATSTVTVNPLPGAITGNTTICAGFTTQLSEASAGGVWSSSTVTVATVGSLTGLVTGINPGSGITSTTVITYTLPTFCAATTTVTVNPLPGVVIGPTAVCSGLTITLTDLTSGGTWSSSNNAVASIGVTSGVLTGGVVTTPTTVTITYTLGTGCTATTNVTVNPLPASIVAPAMMCAGQTTTLSDATAGGTWSSSNISAAVITPGPGAGGGVLTAQPIPLPFSAITVIDYTLATGCLSTATITVNPLPTAITGITSICSGGTTQLSDATGTGNWSSSSITVATVNGSGLVTGGIVVAPSGPQSAVITYSLVPTGCTATATVTVNPLPTLISGNTTICSGLTTTLSNGSSGTWVSNNTSVATVTAGPGTTTIVTAGSVLTQSTATVTITAGAGCTQSIAVTVNPLPVAITGNTIICAGLTTTLSDATPGGTWSSSVLTTATVGSTTGLVTGGAVLTQKFSTITYTIPTGCIITTTVTVNPLPGAIGGPGAVCSGSTTDLSDGVTGGVWSSSNPVVATIVAAGPFGVLTGGNPGVDTITYTLGTGCMTTKTVTVNIQPAAITGGPLSICQGATGLLSDATGGGIWSTANSALATVIGGVVTAGHTTTGNTTITYSIGSCTSSTLVFVNAQPGPITGTTTMCNGMGTTLSDATGGGFWSAGNTVVSIGGVVGTVTSNAAGIDTISYTIGSCISTTTVLVNVQPLTITGTTGICDLSSTTLSEAIGGGIWSAGNTNASVGSVTGIVTGTMPLGSATGTTLITNTQPIGGCFSSILVTIHTVPVAITGNTQICNGLTTQLSDGTGGGVWSVSTSTISVATISNTGFVTGLSAGSGGTDGYALITYTIGSCYETTTVTVHPLPSPISGIFDVCQFSATTLGDLTPLGTWSSSSAFTASIGAGTGIATGNNLGTATITYTLPTGCIATHTLTVIQVPGPVLGSGVVCAGDSTTLTDIDPLGTWTSSNMSVATINGSSGVTTGVSSGTAVISYTLGTGCSVVAPFTVNPLSPVTGVMSVCIGQTTDMIDTTAGGTWSSSNAGIATVNQVTGVVQGVSAGPVIISYNLPTGCTATATVTVGALPAPITGGSTTICDGSQTMLSDATAGGIWSSSNVLVATVDASGTVTGSGNTGTSVSTVIITYTSGCFITTTVTVEPLPQPVTGNTGICQGLMSALADATPGGTWSSSNTLVATIGSGTGVITGGSAGTATITYSLPTGCMTTIAVTVYPLPSAITGTTNVCVGSQTTLSDATLSGAWFSSNGSVATINLVTGVVTGISPGTAVIDYYGITGCVTTTTVTVNPVPSAIVPVSPSVCVGSALTLFSGGGAGTWSAANPAVATIGSVSGVVTGVTGGTSVISYTFSSTGCAAATTVTVNPVPDTITGITTVCYGMTTNLYDATPGGLWSSSAPSVCSVTATTGVVYGNAPAGSAIITYQLLTGCSVSTTVTVNPPPTLISGPSTTCPGSQITLIDGTSGGTWTSSNTLVGTIDPASGVLSGVNPGFTIVTYTMGGGACFQVYAVTVNPLPAAITGITSVCAGLTTNLFDITPGGVWSSSTLSVATITPGPGSGGGVVSGGGVLTQQFSAITYTIPATGCTATTTVTVNPLPAPVSGNTNVCLGDTRTLSDSPTPGTWSSSNTNITTVTTLSGSSSGVVYGTGPGTDIVTYTISATGCIMTATVTVHPLPAVYTVTGGGSYCSDTSGVPVGLSGSQIGVDYLLYLGSTPVGTFAGTGSALSFGLQTLSGTYTVVALNTFTTCSNSMTGSAVVTVILSPVPAVSISTGGAGDTVCAGTVVNYTATGVNGGSTPVYQWSVNGIAVSTGNTYSYVPANNNEVVVTMTSSLHCANPMTVSDTVIMTVLTPVRPSVGLVVSPADTVCLGSAVTLTAVPSYGGATPVYLWTVDGTGITSTTGPVYMYVPSNGDIVSCRMVSDYRCVLGADTVSGPAELITVDTPQVLGVTIVSSPGWGISQGASDTLYAVVTNGGLTPTYQWYVNGVPVPGATTPEFVSNSFSYPNEDSVSCVVTGSGYCPESGHGWMYITVNAAGVTQVSSAMAELSVIPNPNNGTFTLKGTLGTTADEVVSLELTDVLGQVVYKQEVQTRGGSINDKITLSNTLANGMYMLNVQSASVTKVFHIVIEQ